MSLVERNKQVIAVEFPMVSAYQQLEGTLAFHNSTTFLESHTLSTEDCPPTIEQFMLDEGGRAGKKFFVHLHNQSYVAVATEIRHGMEHLHFVKVPGDRIRDSFVPGWREDLAFQVQAVSGVSQVVGASITWVLRYGHLSWHLRRWLSASMRGNKTPVILEFVAEGDDVIARPLHS